MDKVEATTLAADAKRKGNECFGREKWDLACRHYSVGLNVDGAVDPQLLAQLHSNRAAAHLHMNRPWDAKEDAKRAIALQPSWTKAHVRLAEVYKATHKYDKAIAQLEQALALADSQGEGATAVRHDVRNNLSVYRLDLDRDDRREGENRSYDPSFSEEAAMSEVFRAQLGLSENGPSPSAFMQSILEQAPGDELTKGQRAVTTGHLALRRGDAAAAARAFLSAAVEGNAEAMYNYGVMLQAGKGVQQDLEESFRWFERAAACEPLQFAMFPYVGISDAMASLGRYYSLGIVVDKDDKKAVEYWEKAAELGSVVGLNNLGFCLMNGSHGLTIDLPRAQGLLRLAAEGHANEAMTNLALLHQSLSEFKTAAQWAESAVQFGDMNARKMAVWLRKRAETTGNVPPQLDGVLDEESELFRKVCTTQVTPERQNETPTLEELSALTTPYGRRLYQAKQFMQQASQAFNNGDMVGCVAHAAKANRIDDGMLVFAPEEVMQAQTAAALVTLCDGWDADLALLMFPPSPSRLVQYWLSAHIQFPDDQEIASRAASICMFASLPGSNPLRGRQIFRKLHARLSIDRLGDQGQYVSVLYSLAAASFHTGEFEESKTWCEAFLRVAEQDGYRKANEGHFMLGLIALRQGDHATKSQCKKKLKKRNMKQTAERRLALATDHLQRGMHLSQELPAFLQGELCESETFLLLKFLVAIHEAKYGSNQDDVSEKRGGEVLPGPRRHPKLRSEMPELLIKLRKQLAQAKARAISVTSQHGCTVPLSLQPSKRSKVGKTRSSLRPASIEELLSPLKDQVFEDRLVECVVVSMVCFTGSSHMFIVEDSKREPIRVAIYNATSSLVERLVLGRCLTVLGPYMRYAQDGHFLLRVDDPMATIELGELKPMCWNCLKVPECAGQTLKRCGKCRVATYCSRECQGSDWKANGHRLGCGAVHG
ncbi:hypothetical protein PINS_up010445 [Pythium insidiosum]|nr:hypothetical protein PINS_up010445 [Pythium insidiosum]